MIIESQQAEEQAVLNLAYSLCAAARTAPKGRGVDCIETALLTGEDNALIAKEMRRIGDETKRPNFIRDANNVDESDVTVLVGVRCESRGLNEICRLCGFEDCAACTAAGATCVFASIDLGVAIGSAVALAADHRIDNRIMFTIGQAAVALGMLSECKVIMGIPLSATGKSPFFDR